MPEADAERSRGEGDGPDQELAREIGELIRSGRKIEAIKRYRGAMGVGLREAKEKIEALSGKHGIQQGRGCAGLLLLAASLAGGIAAAVS